MRRDLPRISSSRPEHFRAAIATVQSLNLRLQQLADADHPLKGWLVAAELMAVGLETGEMPGDRDLPVERDRGLLRFIEEQFVPAARLCRLAGSIANSHRLHGAVAAELASLALVDDFYHSEYVLYVATKIAVTCGVRVDVFARGSTPAPDLAVASEQCAIECRARGNERGRAPRAGLAVDFDHAGKKFNSFLPRNPGWVGVVAVDLGIVGGPGFEEIGRAGPSLTELRSEIEAGFALRSQVSAFVGAMVSATPRPVSSDPKADITVAPLESSGYLYATTFARRLACLERTFHPWPEAGAAVQIERHRPT